MVAATRGRAVLGVWRQKEMPRGRAHDGSWLSMVCDCCCFELVVGVSLKTRMD
jgi:hypothetical protein